MRRPATERHTCQLPYHYPLVTAALSFLASFRNSAASPKQESASPTHQLPRPGTLATDQAPTQAHHHALPSRRRLPPCCTSLFPPLRRHRLLLSSCRSPPLPLPLPPLPTPPAPLYLRLSAAAASSTLSLIHRVPSASALSSTAAANAASVLYSCVEGVH